MFVVWLNGAELELNQLMMRDHNTRVANSDRTAKVNRISPTSEPSAVVEIEAFSQSYKGMNIDLSANAISHPFHEFKYASKQGLFQKLFA